MDGLEPSVFLVSSQSTFRRSRAPGCRRGRTAASSAGRPPEMGLDLSNLASGLT